MLLQNRYEIIQELGEGGFGKAFIAEDTQMPSHRKCVIKQLKPISDNPNIYQIIQERFNQEAVILEKLGTENKQIPSLYAYFENDNLFYLVQEYVDGITLTNLVQQRGVLSESGVRDFLLKILPVFDFIHSQHIIHRDIKPDNLILRHSDQLPVLIDFGAVKETMGTIVTTSGTPNSSIIIGSPGFMPSEQSIGRPVFATDLYALGLTAIFLLTGKYPQEFSTNQTTGEIQWLEYCQTPVTADFAAILNKAIASHHRDRYLKARDMLEALQGKPVSNPPPPVPNPAPLPQPTIASYPQQTTPSYPQPPNYPPQQVSPNYLPPTTPSNPQATVVSNPSQQVTPNYPPQVNPVYPDPKIQDNSKGLNEWQKALIIGSIIGLFMMFAVIVSSSFLGFSPLVSNQDNSNDNSSDNTDQKDNNTDSTQNQNNTQNSSNNSQSSNNSNSNNQLSNQDALTLINKWLSYKKEIFGPSHSIYLGSEILTGKAYHDNISRTDGQESSSEWLRNNNSYYTYGLQRIDEIKNLTINGNNATVDVVITEERTLYNSYGKIDPNQTGSDQRLVRYYLSLDGGNWKISDYQTLQKYWEN